MTAHNLADYIYCNLSTCGRSIFCFFFLELLLCSTSHLLSILLVEKARLPHLHPRKKVSSMRCSNQSPATTAVIGTLLELNYIASWPCLVFYRHNSREENLACMEYWMKSICKTFSGMSVIFRDESNDGN